MTALTVRTPKRQLQCAQPPHLSFGSFNPGVDDLGGGRTTVDQHDASFADFALQILLHESQEAQEYHQRGGRCRPYTDLPNGDSQLLHSDVSAAPNSPSEWRKMDK